MTSAEQATPRLRLTILLLVVASLFAALFARLWFLQVINAPKAEALAANNGVRIIYTPAPRGDILDRSGRVLAGNINVPVIEVSQQVAAGNPDMVSRLAPLLGMSVPQLKRAINNLEYSPYVPVPVVEDASPQKILYIQENQSLFPGVQATTATERQYTPLGIAAANIVGYVNQINSTELAQLKGQGYQPGDQIGQDGVEATYESVLRGTPGVTKVQVDSQGNVLTTLSSTPPVQGLDLKLTIDGNIQAAAEGALQAGLLAAQQSRHNGVYFPASKGAVVVEDPQNGSILALATYPNYDPEEFATGISQNQYDAWINNPNTPLFDEAIGGQWAPGSTFKLVTATAGLKYGVVTPDSVFDDTGSITIGAETFSNDNGDSYGPITLPTAITVSSDNYFNTIGAELWDGYVSSNQYPQDALQNVAEAYGFNEPTGIALPDESCGLIPTPNAVTRSSECPRDPGTGQWYTGNSADTAIGQFQVTVTPLQLANAYSTFANGGTLWEPRIAVAAVKQSGDVVKAYASQPKGSVSLAPDQRAAMLAGFEGVVQNPHGTAAGIFTGPLANMDVAGKTGTAQVTGKQSTSIFTSFAPATNPQYEVTAILDQAGYGADIAAPVVRQVYDALYGLPLQPISFVNESGAQN